MQPDTRGRILEGALRALGSAGVRRFTMQDVSQHSGLARGTVYRYFPTKEALLEVLAEYERDRFAGGLQVALQRTDTTRSPLHAVAQYTLTYLREHPALILTIENEPAFVLGFLRRQLPQFHRITADLLEPVMRQAGPVRRHQLTAAELNELVLRVVLSVFLVPGDSRHAVGGALEGALDSMVRLADS